MERRKLLNTRMDDNKIINIWLDWRQLFLLTLMLGVVAVNAGGESSGESEEALSRHKRDDCECAASDTPLKCRCHSGEDALDQICRCARSIMPSCGCPFRQQNGYNMMPQSFASPCKTVCERSCIQSCTAQLQPVSQCATTCTFTCDKTCSQFQVSIQQLQAAGNKNQAIPHVLILGGTQSPPTCQCAQNEPNCPCNCLPRCEQNCRQNCQANGQSNTQCSNTCSQTCSSTCLANSIVQDSGTTQPPNSVVKGCTQQCPSSCQKVCTRLQSTMPNCQQSCVNKCNTNCLNIPTTTTTEAPTPPPYTPAADPGTQPSRDCVPICQPACLKSCTSVYQQQDNQNQVVAPTYSGNGGLQFGYLYGTQNIQPGLLPEVNKPQLGVYQPPQQPLQYVQPQPQQIQQPQQQQQQSQQYNQNYVPQQQQQTTYVQPQQPQPLQQQPQEGANSKKLVTVTICIPQCMPLCEKSCIQNVANALQQHQLQQQQALQSQQATVTCPAECEPDCRPTCIQSVIQQTQSQQQQVPLPSGSVNCPQACLPACQPDCLINQAPNYLTSGIQQSLNPRGVVQPLASSNYGHLQQSSNQQSKFSMLNKPPTTSTQQPSGPKTCVMACMPLCLDECVNAGMEDKSKEVQSHLAPVLSFINNYPNNKPSILTNLKNQMNQTLANNSNGIPNQIHLNLQQNPNINQTQTFVPRQNLHFNNSQTANPQPPPEPMRVMIHYTSEPRTFTTTTTAPPATSTTTRPFFSVSTTTKSAMFFPKIMPASMVNQPVKPTDPFDLSQLSQQKPNPHFHIGTSTPPSPQTTTSFATTTTASSAGTKSLAEIIQQKCQDSCSRVCESECRKQKDPPDEVCILTCQTDCVNSCKKKFASKILKT